MAVALQQNVHDGHCGAADGVPKLFVDAPEVVDRSLSLIVGHEGRDELAKPGSCSTHHTNFELRQSWIRAAFNSKGALMSDTP